jgi:hypothetical protein
MSLHWHVVATPLAQGNYFGELGRNKNKVQKRMALLGKDAPLLFMVRFPSL